MANAPIGLIVGNWKMNLFHSDSLALVNALAERMQDLGQLPLDVAVCPPFTLIGQTAAFLSPTPIKVGGQDCSPLVSGAHTGDVSAEMLMNLGCACCIVGHSERRRDHGENDALVRAKADAVHRTRMTTILCIGETEADRNAGKTLEVVARQLQASLPESAGSNNTAIAYEPVWAIGTGRTPTLTEIGDVHQHIRELLFDAIDYDGYAVRILYGGSVTPDNAKDILRVPHVNGALVGGASLKAETFLAIIEAAPKPGQVAAPIKART